MDTTVNDQLPAAFNKPTRKRTKGSGLPSTPNMPPPKPMGPWSEEDQAAIVAFNRGETKGTPLTGEAKRFVYRAPKPKAEPSPGPKRASGRGGPKVGSRLYDVTSMVELYEGKHGPKKSPNEIALQIGCAPATVIRYLKEAGVWDETRWRTGGPRAKRDKCKRGHDMTDEANVIQRYKPNGEKHGRECRTCHSLRARGEI